MRLLKPATVLKRWEMLMACMHPKKPGRRQAREYAKLAGMKSMGEVACAADLDKRKVKWIYEPKQLEFHHCEQWDKHKCKVKTLKYTPDFLLPDYNIYIEYKGKMTNDIRKRFLSIQRCHPRERLCIVFEKPNNKLSSRPNSTRYWQWAEQNGFEWSEQVVDPRWLN